MRVISVDFTGRACVSGGGLCAGPRAVWGWRGAVIHHEQTWRNTEGNKLHWKQCFLCLSLQRSSVGRPAAAEEMEREFSAGSAVYLIPTYCTEEEDEEEERKTREAARHKPCRIFVL